MKNLINSRIPFLTNKQIELIKRNIDYPSNMLATIMLTEIIRFFNAEILNPENSKTALILNKVTDNLVTHLITNKNIKKTIDVINQELKKWKITN